jgi:hypothetical protein
MVLRTSGSRKNEAKLHQSANDVLKYRTVPFFQAIICVCTCIPRNIGEKAFQKLQKMPKIGMFTFFAGLQKLPKHVFLSFLTKIDVNQPKEQKKTRKWVF